MSRIKANGKTVDLGNKIKLSPTQRNALFNRCKNKYALFFDKYRAYRVGRIYGVYTHGFKIHDAVGIKQRVPFDDVQGIYLNGRKKATPFKEILQEVQ